MHSKQRPLNNSKVLCYIYIYHDFFLPGWSLVQIILNSESCKFCPSLCNGMSAYWYCSLFPVRSVFHFLWPKVFFCFCSFLWFSVLFCLSTFWPHLSLHLEVAFAMKDIQGRQRVDYKRSGEQSAQGTKSNNNKLPWYRINLHVPVFTKLQSGGKRS